MAAAAHGANPQNLWNRLIRPHVHDAPEPDIHFLDVEFTKDIPDKTHVNLRLPTPRLIQHLGAGNWESAIASKGSFRANRNGWYVFVTKINNRGANNIMIGVTSATTHPQATARYISQTENLPGSGVHLSEGHRHHSQTHSPNMLAEVVNQAKEVVTLVRIANDGASKTIQWIVDGFAGPIADLVVPDGSDTLTPVISIHDQNAEVEVVSPENLGKSLESPLLSINRAFRARAVEFPQDQILLSKESFDPNFPQKLEAKLRRNEEHATLFGLADTGKSSVFNALMCVCSGELLDTMPRAVGSSTVAGGQYSTTPLRERCSIYLAGATGDGWPVNQKGDLILTDTIGFKGDKYELKAYGMGQLRASEPYPRDDRDKQSEILARKVDPNKRVSCFLLFISAPQLINPGNDALDNIVKSVIDGAKNMFKIGDDVFEVPVITVITKCDDLDNSPTPLDLLRQRDSPKLKGVFEVCSKRFGMPESSIVALGWMDDTDHIDFTGSTSDPRTFVLRHLMLKIAGTGELFLRRIKDRE